MAAVAAAVAARRRRRDAAAAVAGCRVAAVAGCRVAAVEVGASLVARRSAAPDRLSGPRWAAERAGALRLFPAGLGWCRSTGSRPRSRAGQPGIDR